MPDPVPTTEDAEMTTVRRFLFAFAAPVGVAVVALFVVYVLYPWARFVVAAALGLLT